MGEREWTLGFLYFRNRISIENLLCVRVYVSIYYIISFDLKTTLIDSIIICVLQIKKWMPQPITVECGWLSAVQSSDLSLPSNCAKREASYSENSMSVHI